MSLSLSLCLSLSLTYTSALVQLTGDGTLLRGWPHLFAATRMLHPGLLPAVPGRTEAAAAAVGARAQLVLHQSLVLLVSSIATARYEIFVSVGVGVTMLAVAVPHEERGALQSVQGCPVGADGHARCGMRHAEWGMGHGADAAPV